MGVLLGFCQSPKIALLNKLSERSDEELQEIILYDGSISTGIWVADTIFATDTDGKNGHFLTCLTLFFF